MSPEFYSRWKFHQKLGTLVLTGMQAFFSFLFMKLNIASVKGIILVIYIAVYIAMIVKLRLNDLYSRRFRKLIRAEAVLAISLGLIVGIVSCLTGVIGAASFTIIEILASIIIYILWLFFMKFWLKRHFCPHTYVCIGDNHSGTGGLMEMDQLDGNIFSSGKYFDPGDEQGLIEYMELFKVGIMVLSDFSQDIYRNMLGICHRLNAMAFMIEKPQLPEYESNIREVYIGDRKLWLYLPLK